MWARRQLQGEGRRAGGRGGGEGGEGSAVIVKGARAQREGLAVRRNTQLFTRSPELPGRWRGTLCERLPPTGSRVRYNIESECTGKAVYTALCTREKLAPLIVTSR